MVTEEQKLAVLRYVTAAGPGSGAHNAPFNYSSVALFMTRTLSFLSTLPDGTEMVCGPCARGCLVPKVAGGRGVEGAPEPPGPAAGRALGCDHVLQRGEGAAAAGSTAGTRHSAHVSVCLWGARKFTKWIIGVQVIAERLEKQESNSFNEIKQTSNTRKSVQARRARPSWPTALTQFTTALERNKERKHGAH